MAAAVADDVVEAQPQELQGVSGEYLADVSRWVETLRNHEIIGTLFSADTEVLTVADGAVNQPLDQQQLQVKLGNMTDNPEKAVLLMTGGIVFMWVNVMCNPTPGVFINPVDVDRFCKFDFNGELPASLRKMAVGLLHRIGQRWLNFGLSLLEPAWWTRLELLSPYLSLA